MPTLEIFLSSGTPWMVTVENPTCILGSGAYLEAIVLLANQSVYQIRAIGS